MGFAIRFRRRLGRLARQAFGSEKVSYAQCGEDIIIEYVLSALGVDKVRYLDIGAHDPVYLSNTYYFYRQGGSGVCIEPNPALIKAFKRVRPNDICLNSGIGEVQGTAQLFVMTTPTLSTFSREEAERYVSYGTEQIESTLEIPMRNINDVIEHECKGAPDFISIDVEGNELSIVKSLDFERWRPKVFCVETLTYEETGKGQKLTGIIEFLQSKRYFLYADTYINSIMVDSEIWRRGETKSASMPGRDS